MEKISTKIEGLYVVQLSEKSDERGFFVRTHCDKEFKDLGLNTQFIQSSLSYNKLKGTLRGMHLQKKPFEELKLVQCLSGKIYDVIVDLRPNSATYKVSQGFELSLESQQALFVPAGCAHGFITLTDNALVQYRMDMEFHPECHIGFRWNDPELAIKWPMNPLVISERDASYPTLKNTEAENA
jgi:dTDP-4-dehydrorhamnose 3,5-epimerase